MNLRPLPDLARQLGLDPQHLHPWGPGRAKIDPAALDRPRAGSAPGRLVLVSAVNPTPAGEGKTVTSIGLAQGLARLGARVAVALREPSMGPVFGIKGGGTGGGLSQLEPAADINLHFTGDLHAVTAAHNLLAAAIDHQLHFGEGPHLDSGGIAWPRVMDVGDRALRGVITGVGGRDNGRTRESHFDITAASEVMAALCLATDETDLKLRLGGLLAGFTASREPVFARDLGVVGAMAALLRHAAWPNLVQTTEGVPAIVHGGPFANIAHGANSVAATRMALHHADWVVTEAGFGFDLGGQKFLHLVVPALGVSPSLVVLVATVQAARWHGAVGRKRLHQPNLAAVQAGLVNLGHHIRSAQGLGLPVVVAINRFPADDPAEVAAIVDFCALRDVLAVPATHFAEGGAGAQVLAQAVCARAPASPPVLRLPGAKADGFEERLSAIAQHYYGADGVDLSPQAQAVLRRAQVMGLGQLPPCIAKTQYSLSDDPGRLGAPTGWRLQVRDLKLAPGAGFLVALAGEINRMPALPRRPAYLDIDLVDGEIVGL